MVSLLDLHIQLVQQYDLPFVFCLQQQGLLSEQLTTAAAPAGGASENGSSIAFTITKIPTAFGTAVTTLTTLPRVRLVILVPPSCSPNVARPVRSTHLFLRSQLQPQSPSVQHSLEAFNSHSSAQSTQQNLSPDVDFWQQQWMSTPHVLAFIDAAERVGGMKINKTTNAMFAINRLAILRIVHSLGDIRVYV